jgi:NDP-sugar pyrophosphorylase family protein
LLDRLPPGSSDSVRDLYAPMVARGERLMGVRVRGAWYDLGNPRLYLEAQTALLASGVGGSLVDPTVRIGRGARVVRSVVGPGSRIGPEASVVDSVLWDGVVVGARGRVRRSILASGVHVARPGALGAWVCDRAGQVWSTLEQSQDVQTADRTSS